MFVFKKFRQGTPLNEIYKEFGISKDQLAQILKRKIKGRYDYDRILASNAAQKQFLSHLNHRWNPLEPDAPFKNIPPYLPGTGIKEKENGTEIEGWKRSLKKKEDS